MQKFILIILMALGFLSCKRSMQQNAEQQYNINLLTALRKLEQKYQEKKVRVNTWDKKADAYLDIQVLNENREPIKTLTIGDSVKFLAIDAGQENGIQAKIKLENNATGYIPYSNIEEFEPATRIDPDLKD